MLKKLQQKIATSLLMTIDFKNYTPFSHKMMRFLCMHGADVNQKCEKGNPVLSKAINNNCTQGVALLIKNGADITCEDASGFSMFDLACAQGNQRLVNLLIYQGANVLGEKNKNGRTPLYYAVINDQVDIAKTLLEHGASVCVHDSSNFTPLTHACFFGNMDMVKALCENNSQQLQHFTPFDWKKCIFASGSHGFYPIMDYIQQKALDFYPYNTKSFDAFAITVINHTQKNKKLFDIDLDNTQNKRG